MNIRLSTFDTVVIAAVAAAGVLGIVLLYWLLGSSSIIITNSPPQAMGPVSALSGVPCERATARPVAVMLSSDPEARPLSGIGEADMVFEMPVTPNGITRVMAVFQCRIPTEIGSIRSARSDFIPLAQGIDAVLVHWGGEKTALDALNGGVIDNVDALKYEGTTFYRKRGIPAPHDGFTTVPLVSARADMLGYRATTSLQLYERRSLAGDRNLGSLAGTAQVDWPQGMDVAFTYDPSRNVYLRTRGGSPEIDATTGDQVSVSVVVLLRTDSTYINDLYMGVTTVGSGTATIWQRGERTNALWKKSSATDMLRLTDGSGTPIVLEPGTVWFLIDAPLPVR